MGTRGSCSSCGPRSARSTPAPSRPGSSSALDAGPRPSAQQSGVLEVVRRAPAITAAGKVLPMLRAAGRREGESGRGEPI